MPRWTAHPAKEQQDSLHGAILVLCCGCEYRCGDVVGCFRIYAADPLGTLCAIVLHTNSNSEEVMRFLLKHFVKKTKMNKKHSLAFLAIPLSILFFAGCASMLQRPTVHTVMKPEEFEKKYSPQELTSDLKMLTETLDAVHPNLYVYSSRSEIDSLRRIVEHELTAPMTRKEFYFRVAPYVARIGDGHTSVSPPREEFAYYRSQQGGLAFPFNVAYDTLSGITIARNYSGDSTLAPGDRMISINGCSADSLFAFYLGGFSGERMVFRQQLVVGFLRMLLWLNNISSPYNLVAERHSSHKQISRHIEGVTLQTVLKIDSSLAMQSVIPSNYRFERLHDSIGYIDFRSMTDLEEFKNFLSTTFAGIQANPVRGLVIDLRNNGGGNSQLGSELLSYLTDSSYRMDQRKEWKMSAQYKVYMRQMIPWWIRWFPVTWVSSEARHYLGAKDGEIVIDTAALEPPEANSLRYRGKTCFLIGPRTFSSAMMLANAVADYKLATLIGEETGGIPTAYGEVYPFDLPNTKLAIGVSSAFFVRANGNTEDRRGVMPDIEVRQTEEDTRLGKDTVLERARRWILNSIQLGQGTAAFPLPEALCEY